MGKVRAHRSSYSIDHSDARSIILATMRFVWKPKANNFWQCSLDVPVKVALKALDGHYHDTDIRDMGYVCKVSDSFAVRFYGSLYSGAHPIERCVYATKEDAMASAERHATAILAAKILSR